MIHSHHEMFQNYLTSSFHFKSLESVGIVFWLLWFAIISSTNLSNAGKLEFELIDVVFTTWLN